MILLLSNYYYNRKRATETEKSVQDLEQNLELTTVRRKHLINTVKESSSILVSQLETELQTEKDKNNDILLNKREYEIRIENLEREKVDLHQYIDEAEKTIKIMEKELTENRQTIVDLTQQLSHSFEARKQGKISVYVYIHVYIYMTVQKFLDPFIFY